MESPSRPSSLINPRAAETSRSRVSPCCLSPSGLTGNDSPLNIVVRVAYLTMLEVMLHRCRLTPLDKEERMIEKKDQFREMDPVVGAWHGWASPVGLGLFFVLVAVAVDLVRL